MAEGPMKLISVHENDGAMSAKFSFSTNMLEGEDFTSPTYYIHKIAAIKFLLKHVSDGQNCYFIQARKKTLAKELGIQLQVVCKEPEFNIPLSCTFVQVWSKWHSMGTSKDKFFNVQFDVKMSKGDLLVLKLYKDVEFTDFQLSTAEGSVAVHKAHLAATSEVFNTMLSREWKETTEGCIKLEGVTLQTLKHLKDYMYLGALPEVNWLCPLLLIARCYLMDDLKADCLTKLTQTVTSENLYDILEFSFSNKFPEITFAVLGAMSETLKHLKDYMYLGALPEVNWLCPLLLIARCYLMDDLKADCLTKLTQTVTSENLYDILEFSFSNKFPEITFAVLGAMSEKMVDDARKIMTENQKSCNKVEDDKIAEPESSNEETNE